MHLDEAEFFTSHMRRRKKNAFCFFMKIAANVAELRGVYLRQAALDFDDGIIG
jgi:hypothetical protein